MKLRGKTLLIIGATLAGLTVLLGLASKILLMGSFDRLQEEDVRQNQERALAALREDLAALDVITHEYSAWDDTYQFVQDRDPAYVSRHLPTEEDADLGVELLALLDASGRMLFGKALDLKGRATRPLPESLLAHLSAGALLAGASKDRSGRTGVLLLPEGPVLAAFRPILKNQDRGQSRGTLFMGRFLDRAAVSRLAKTTRLALSIQRLDDRAAPVHARSAASRLSKNAPVLVEALDRAWIAGYALVDDIYGRPALVLRVQMPRRIHERARMTLIYFAVSGVLVALAFGVAILTLLERVVLSRLKRLAASVRSIRARRDLAARAAVEGGDEIADLAHAVNDMLEALEGNELERREAELALRESEERYALAARAANDGLWDWNVRTGEVYFSPRWKGMLGRQEDEVEGKIEEWFSRVHPEDLPALWSKIETPCQRGNGHLEREHRMLHKDGSYRWMLSRWVVIQGPDGAPERLVGSHTDITARKTAESRLLHEALYDALTGLPNRNLFHDRVRQALAMARRRNGHLCGVLFLDIDRFKVVNDSLGHATGDRLLGEIARRLEASVRPGDTVARLGGDEFTILLEGIKHLGEATHIAERIQGELAKPFYLADNELFTSASLGIAISSEGSASPEDLIRDADTAMYRAKALGKARHQVFDGAMHTQALAALQLESDLRRALERGEFAVFYQPIVSLGSGSVVGFEALVRWRHPTRGLVLPAEFIPLAEETGLIVPLGEWVLREACLQGRRWETELPRPLAISVNLSGRQLMEPDLCEVVQGILAETGFPPRCLHLEITESVIMQKADLAAVVLSRLGDMGIRLSIDDFGTGYSSLSHLHLLAVDTLKIDRSFVTGLADGGKQRRIVETILMLGRNLGIDVIAEGVEGEEQRSTLASLQCGLGQGYLFSVPVEADAAQRLLATAGRHAEGGNAATAGTGPVPSPLTPAVR